MPLNLPDEKREGKKLKVRTPPMVQNDALSPEDTIEYGVTEEVSPGPGRKAWVRFAATSSVREGETTDQATNRVATYVNEEIDRRIEALGD